MAAYQVIHTYFVNDVEATEERTTDAIVYLPVRQEISGDSISRNTQDGRYTYTSGADDFKLTADNVETPRIITLRYDRTASPGNPGTPVTPVNPVTPVTPVTPNIPDTPTPAGPSPVAPGTNISDEDVPLGLVVLNTIDHIAYIIGYMDGTFKANWNITRAEAVTLINRMLDRMPDKDHLLEDMIRWPDNTEDKWYYEDMQEATSSHDYDRDEMGIMESGRRSWRNAAGRSLSTSGQPRPLPPAERLRITCTAARLKAGARVRRRPHPRPPATVKTDISGPASP